MRRSIATVTLGGSLKDKLYAIAAAGFDAVELTEAAFAYSEMEPAMIRQQLEETGLTISLFHSVADIEGVAPDAFDQVLAKMERKFALMGELGANLLGLTSNSGTGAIDDESLIVEQLKALADAAQRHGIRIGYEAVNTGRIISRYADAWRIVEAAAHPALGLIADSFEILANGEDLAPLASIPGDRIFMVQLADAPASAIDTRTLGQHFRCFPGQGALDVVGFAAHVLDAGYEGPFSLEVMNDVVRGEPVRSAALDAYRSLVFVEERLFATGRKTNAPVFAASGPPAEPADESVGFIEFAVNSQNQAELEDWLKGMGFQLAGKHRSKDVTLYRQGDVLVVLNAGSDTFAHYYQHLHGLSVCAIGLRLRDPGALLARADLYKYKRYEEPIGPQEYMMPAVRSPDGSLIHLLDADYDPGIDFVLDDDTSSASGNIAGIDHLVRAVPEDQFDSWVLFYRAMLGLKADKSLDLPDPHGIVHSRALHDAGNRLRLPLTYSESSKTVVARSLSTFDGSGINQIAFETQDIFAAVEDMRARGVPLLRIPANYYRDLVDRCDLSEDSVTRLQEASILYDCDAKGGRFFHAYTEYFHGRFFFEVVQRENGYAGYGEVNAPVRMAAQANLRQRRGIH